MKIAFVQCGLPGPAYHGGAVTCWAVLRAMLSEGHRVTLISLFDTSTANPYLESRATQTALARELGADVRFIEYDHFKISPSPSSLFQRVTTYLPPRLENLFPWARLRNRLEGLLSETRPDAIFVYHFDALAAVFRTTCAPVAAGVGDLWHLPSAFLWQAQPATLRKYTIGLALQAVHTAASEHWMKKMLAACALKGAFAAHYAEWLRTQPGLDTTVYFRTPAHDPVGDDWRQARMTARAARPTSLPKILMIGDITGTAARWGLRLLIHEVLPTLDATLGEKRYELHLVGGGQIESEFQSLYSHPAVRVRGRVVPPDQEFLSADVLFVPTPITLGIRVRIITGFSYGCALVTHEANRAGIPEIETEKNALVADSGIELARHLIRVVQSPQQRDQLEGAARETFCRLFCESVAAREIVHKIEDMVRRK